jgi:hypothetical protein
VWIGASACLAIAIPALAAGSEEFREFSRQGVPALNRINVAASIGLVVTGAGKLVSLMVRGFAPSTMFVYVLFMKIGLFMFMTAALAASCRAAATLKAQGGTSESPASARRVAWLSGLTAAMGGAAMLLGLWLVGS